MWDFGTGFQMVVIFIDSASYYCRGFRSADQTGFWPGVSWLVVTTGLVLGAKKSACLGSNFHIGLSEWIPYEAWKILVQWSALGSKIEFSMYHLASVNGVRSMTYYTIYCQSYRYWIYTSVERFCRGELLWYLKSIVLINLPGYKGVSLMIYILGCILNVVRFRSVRVEAKKNLGQSSFGSDIILPLFRKSVPANRQLFGMTSESTTFSCVGFLGVFHVRWDTC